MRFLYGDENLYVGALLHDSEPGRLITNELTRDFAARDGDLFVLVLDTFNDLRNSYGFQTNPGGAWRDTQSFDEARTTNQNWDGVWTVKTATTKDGWIVEYAIPFKTLRFPRPRTLSWTGGSRTGEFWDGTRDGVSGGVRVRVDANVATTATMSRDMVTLKVTHLLSF